jgi:hypothetical protein
LFKKVFCLKNLITPFTKAWRDFFHPKALFKGFGQKALGFGGGNKTGINLNKRFLLFGPMGLTAVGFCTLGCHL